MKQVCLFLIALTALPVMAEKYTYVWSEVFPNYEKQTPTSDFTLDDLFQIDTEKATGVTGQLHIIRDGRLYNALGVEIE